MYPPAMAGTRANSRSEHPTSDAILGFEGESISDGETRQGDLWLTKVTGDRETDARLYIVDNRRGKMAEAVEVAVTRSPAIHKSRSSVAREHARVRMTVRRRHEDTGTTTGLA